MQFDESMISSVEVKLRAMVNSIIIVIVTEPNSNATT